MTLMGAHGEGGITRTRDGRLAVRVTMSDGARITRMIPARLVKDDPKAARRQAERLRRELVEARDLDLDPTRRTLADYLRSWIEALRDAPLDQRKRPRTLEHYAMIVERHLIPGLDPRGTLPVGHVSKRKIEAWMARDKGSRQTVRLHHGVLRNALESAVGDLIPSNPAKAAKPPRRSDFRGNPLTFDEARLLMSAAIGTRLHPLWRLALVTGLREGELLGLAWDDLAGDTLHVHAQLQRIEGSWRRSTTKAARSLKYIALDPTTVALLDEHRKRQALERQPDWGYWGLMFVKPSGVPYHGADALREFHAVCNAAGIARRRVHDLRHATDTLMDELGVPENVRMARLGHSTKEMARRYTQVRETQDRAAVERLAEALA